MGWRVGGLSSVTSEMLPKVDSLIIDIRLSLHNGLAILGMSHHIRDGTTIAPLSPRVSCFH